MGIFPIQAREKGEFSTYHIIQHRFRGAFITDDTHLLEVSKYIHNSPVKASIVQRPQIYRWSSDRDYIRNMASGFIDISKVLDVLSNTRANAIKEYINNVNKIGRTTENMDIEDHHLSIKENTVFIDSISHAKKTLEYMLADRSLSMKDCIENKAICNEMIRYLRKNSNLTLKEMGQVFGGISESRISRISSS